MAKTAAAFYDVDGTLLSTNVVHTYAWYAVNQASITDKLRRSAGLMAALPLYAVADRVGRKLFNDLFYKNYAGMSEDRLYLLGREMFEKYLRPKVFPEMVDLMKRSRAEGYLQVLVTGALDTIVGPLAEDLGVDAWFANRLEIIDGFATGNLVPPVLAGPEKATIIRNFAVDHDLDLTACRAYADSASDIPMLCAVGRPCAVNPDLNLRGTARAHDWPVLAVRQA